MTEIKHTPDNLLMAQMGLQHIDDYPNVYDEELDVYVVPSSYVHLIEHACNSHYDLIAALDKAIITIDAVALSFELDGFPNRSVALINANNEFKKALSKAKGETE